MRFVSPEDVETSLPDDWHDQVEKAWSYVWDKMKKARRKAKDDGKSKRECRDEFLKARSDAITKRSALWSGWGKIVRSIMNDKCWYCEAYEARSDMPVDHYRPKNRVFEDDNHPGYWWLAFEWKNFRYSCTFCNSKRVDVETEGGKHDCFPILVAADRTYSPNVACKEAPYLLDPCDDDDPKLLTYLENGLPQEACQDKARDEYKRANKSIELLHLKHTKARRQRQQIAIAIRESVASVQELEGESTKTETTLREIKKRKRELIKRVRAKAPYCTAARGYLAKYRHIPWVEQLWEKDL